MSEWVKSILNIWIKNILNYNIIKTITQHHFIYHIEIDSQIIRKFSMIICVYTDSLWFPINKIYIKKNLLFWK